MFSVAPRDEGVGPKFRKLFFPKNSIQFNYHLLSAYDEQDLMLFAVDTKNKIKTVLVLKEHIFYWKCLRCFCGINVALSPKQG